MSAIYVEIGGKPRPITECSWVQVAPCGCTCSVLSAGGEHNMPNLTDEEQVLDFFDTPNWQRKQDADNGFRYYLIDRTQACDQIRKNCPHIPKWGVEPRPQIDGMQWVTKHGSRRWHLAPASGVIHAGELLKDRERDTEALCGEVASYWREDEFAEMPDCKKCTKAARERMPQPLDLEAVS